MNTPKPTKEALTLNKALNDAGIATELEHNDGHKHVDIYIPKGKIYIEIDGPSHYTDANQIISDFQRDHYSDDGGFHTLRIANEIIESQSASIAKALKKMLSF